MLRISDKVNLKISVTAADLSEPGRDKSLIQNTEALLRLFITDKSSRDLQKYF